MDTPDKSRTNPPSSQGQNDAPNVEETFDFQNDNAIISSLDAANLRSHGLLGSGNAVGTCRLHKRLLNPSSDVEYRDISLDVSLDSTAAATDNAFALIPTDIVSLETLKYVGLSEAKANKVWSTWTNWPYDDYPRETDPDLGQGLVLMFIDFILGSFRNQPDAIEDDDIQWRECLDRCGIDTDVQDAIMDPHFKDLRLSESCIYWARDTIEMRYAGLKEIQKTSREREVTLRQEASLKSVKNQNVSLSSSIGQLSSIGGQSSVSGIQYQGSPVIELEVWASVRALAARNAQGYTVLYKGIDRGRISSLFDAAGGLDSIDTLVSSAPSDFNNKDGLFYFTPQLEVAQYYAACAKRRASCDAVVIVCIRIPNAAIERLSAPQIQHIYWPDPEWKQLIWHSRRNRPYQSHLTKYKQAALVIGTTARKPNVAYHNMNSWQEVDQNCVLKVPGDHCTAVQYAFSGDEEKREILDNINAQDISVFSYPYSEPQA